MLYILLLCVITIVNVCKALDESPLCIYCECNTTYFSQWDPYDIIVCTNKLRIDVFDESNWRNTTTAYRIWSLTVQHNFIGDLSRKFPSSMLTELNLSNNEITSINVDIFLNISYLEILILSNNGIENFSVNTSAVSNIKNIFLFC